ncbi:hypothetical protein AVEN_105960-1 [Araneus ventricosus]|uniref:Uncharacterized protein n=1 Tax=Araneus ventricosus TaxID=182803 RepID=A0A4Y2DV44_ARAVE|nr:hypothetical protein AVEN_105960-1 [Araneus ventricosus]
MNPISHGQKQLQLVNYFRTDLVILNHTIRGQHLSWHILSRFPPHTSWRTFDSDIYGGSSVESGLEPGTLRLRSPDLNTSVATAIVIFPHGKK